MSGLLYVFIVCMGVIAIAALGCDTEAERRRKACRKGLRK